ncbi:hypothetical protein VL762_11775 [Flavobacterium psychrophilum]|uniref:hypothetical protein n=1 Tax=Flavobacterium psychrophilum TaxID=96345 RepID=UPI002D0F2023|nr:hypothetical protein [Flavobacterium psychrophilum]
MKKIIIIACLAILSSCGNKASETPKCDDKEVTETVSSILLENKNSLIDEFGKNGVILNENDMKIINVITTNKNDELKSCNCEGTLESYTDNGVKITTEGNVIYFAQKNSEGEVVVKIDDAGPFNIKK